MQGLVNVLVKDLSKSFHRHHYIRRRMSLLGIGIPHKNTVSAFTVYQAIRLACDRFLALLIFDYALAISSSASNLIT